MKKVISTFLVIIISLTALPFAEMNSFAATSGDFEYSVISETDKTCEIKTYKGTTSDLNIPSKLDGYTVMSIGNGTFNNCTSLTSITMPNSVTSIGDLAFSGCTSLKSITIPNSVTSIGVHAFRYCTSLTNITLPNSIKRIKNYTFWQCTSLTSITIPDSVTSIGDGAFDNCTSLTSITIPDSVTSIEGGAFSACTSLTEIIVDINNLHYNSENGILFNKSKSKLLKYPSAKTAKTYSIPDSVTSIGSNAFSGCTSLTSITIPDSVTSIGNGAFDNCTSLTSITIPDSVTSIKGDAFRYCTSLTSITIPNSVTSIEDFTFWHCTSLTSITIPDSITFIGGNAFRDCTSFTIYGYSDSYAKTYANKNNIPFVALDAVELSSISIATQPSKKTYYIGDSLNTNGLQLKLTYSDGSTETVSSGYTVSGFSSTTAGTKTITVNYEGLTTTFNVTVNTPSISLSASSKTMTVGDTATLSATTAPSGQSVSWSSSNTNVASVSNGVVTAKASGTATITAKFTYNGKTYSKTCSVTVNSIQKTLSSISISSNPTKTIYEIGESLDTSGLRLKLNYSDGSTEIISSGFTTSGFSSSTAGAKTVTVSYAGKLTTFKVTVNAPTIDENAPQISMNSVTTAAGKEITLDLMIENNPGIAGLAVSLKYDENVLSLKEVKNGDLFSAFTAAKNYIWDESENVNADGKLATFIFTVAEDANAGDYTIEIITRSCANIDLDDVELFPVNPTITVIDFLYGDANGDGDINMKDVVLLRKYMANFDYDTETSTVTIELGADANGDGQVNMKDVVLLRKYMANFDYDTGTSSVVLGPQ